MIIIVFYCLFQIKYVILNTSFQVFSSPVITVLLSACFMNGTANLPAKMSFPIFYAVWQTTFIFHNVPCIQSFSFINHFLLFIHSKYVSRFHSYRRCKNYFSWASDFVCVSQLLYGEHYFFSSVYVLRFLQKNFWFYLLLSSVFH